MIMIWISVVSFQRREGVLQIYVSKGKMKLTMVILLLMDLMGLAFLMAKG